MKVNIKFNNRPTCQNPKVGDCFYLADLDTNEVGQITVVRKCYGHKHDSAHFYWKDKNGLSNLWELDKIKWLTTKEVEELVENGIKII